MNVQARYQGDMETDGPAPDDQRRSIVEFIGDRARFIRTETVRLARIAGAGHYTSVFSAAEVLAVLYYSELRIRPDEPGWPDRDRFVLSKGHAAIGLYPVLADRGYFDKAELDTYSRLGSRFGDHPDMKKVPGIDFSSGSLGHGLSVAVGLALAGRARKSIARTFVLLGDGELAEGQIWEAAMAAGHYRLGRLVAIVDANQLCIDGFTADVMTTEPIDERFRAFGWNARRVDGHDVERLLETFKGLSDTEDGSPQLIVADTVKGKGVKRMELSLDWHVGNLAGRDYDEVMSELGGEGEQASVE
jgi:transketolase